MGVNSGKIVAGDTGYKDRREFAIIGNPAHVAARLEAASEELNAAIVASDVTYDVVRDLFVEAFRNIVVAAAWIEAVAERLYHSRPNAPCERGVHAHASLATLV